MPPGAVATGHFRENTAILSLARGGWDDVNGRWFHENSMSRRSPAKPLTLDDERPTAVRWLKSGEHEDRWIRRR
jgi:hypothetical protein